MPLNSITLYKYDLPFDLKSNSVHVMMKPERQFNNNPKVEFLFLNFLNLHMLYKQVFLWQTPY